MNVMFLSNDIDTAALSQQWLLRGSDGGAMSGRNVQRSCYSKGATLQLGPFPSAVSSFHATRQRRLFKNQRYVNHNSIAVQLSHAPVPGEPVYEAVRPIGANTELVVFYLPGLHDDDEELLYGGLPAVRSLRSSLFRRTMGLILQGEQPSLFDKFTFFSSSVVQSGNQNSPRAGKLAAAT